MGMRRDSGCGLKAYLRRFVPEEAAKCGIVVRHELAFAQDA
jgi:hypothetical protein